MSELQMLWVWMTARVRVIRDQHGDDAGFTTLEWVAIAAVSTMLAGIYGMNFDHMPELRWVGGYPAALALMAAVCGALYLVVRRRDWL